MWISVGSLADLQEIEIIAHMCVMLGLLGEIMATKIMASVTIMATEIMASEIMASVNYGKCNLWQV